MHSATSPKKSISRWAQYGLLMGGVTLALFIGIDTARAECEDNCIMRIVWQATIKGTVAVQDYNSSVNPIQKTKRVNNTSFMASVLGRLPNANEVLAVVFELDHTGTNVFLEVFDTSARLREARIAASQSTTMFLDGKRGAFTSAMPIEVAPYFPYQIGGNIRGGDWQLTGLVSQVRNVPTRVQCDVRGFIIATPSTTPPYGLGMTGLVMQASIRTKSPPLQVEPQVVPQTVP
jgi:hypothetical protein